MSTTIQDDMANRLSRIRKQPLPPAATTAPTASPSTWSDDKAEDIEDVPVASPAPAAAVKRAASRRRLPVGLLKNAGFVGLGLLAGLVGARIKMDRSSVISINGTSISAKEFRHRCELASGNAVAQQMVKEELQLQFAEKQGVLPGAAEVEAKYQEAAKNPDFLKTLAAQHKTPEDFRRGILLDLANAAILGKGVTVSPDEVFAFYNANSDQKNPNARYYRPEAVQVAAIITDKPADIQKAIHDLASGASFAAVAAKYSKDASRANSGLLPAIRRGQMDAGKFPGLEQALFGMQTGQQRDDIKIGNTYWLVRCVGRQTEAAVPFDKVKAECEQLARLEKGAKDNGASIQAESVAFQKAAEIKAFDTQYTDAVSLK